MEQSTETPTKVIHPRIPAALHEQVSEYARESHRTLNGAVVALLEQALLTRQRETEAHAAAGLHFR